MGDAANIKIAEINAQAALNQAQIAADASRFGTKTAAGASMYGADQGLAGSNVAANASMYGADKQAASAAAQTSAFRDVSAMRDAGETRRNQATIDAGIVNTGITNAPYSQSSTNAMDTASQRYTAPRMGYLSGSNTSPSASSLTPRVSGGGDNSLTKGMSEGTFELDGASRRFSKGTAKVPGHGDGTVDTVDAKLAPGEAVLNKAAAEMLGRGLIDLLNKHGMLQMGMPEPDADDMEEPEEQGYACGTSNVRHYATGTGFVAPPYDSWPIDSDEDSMSTRSLYISPVSDPFMQGSRTNFDAPRVPQAMRTPAGPPMPQRLMGGSNPPGASAPSAGYIGGGMTPPPRVPPTAWGSRPPVAGAGPVTMPSSQSEMRFEQPSFFGDEMRTGNMPQAQRPVQPVQPVAPAPQATPAAGFQPAPQPPVQMGGPQFGVAPERPVNLAPASAPARSGPPAGPPMPGRPEGPPNINNNMSFDQAFKAARDAFGGQGGAFDWHGKSYQTNVKGENYAKNPVKF